MERFKKIIWERDSFTCQVCGKKPAYQVHHIIPRRKGGSDDPDNLITLCGLCHMLISPTPDFAVMKAFKIPIDEVKRRRIIVKEKLRMRN